MKKPGLGERFRYWFDNVMAKGAGSLIGLLSLVTLLFIALGWWVNRRTQAWRGGR